MFGIHSLTHSSTYTLYMFTCMSVTLSVKCWAVQGLGFTKVNQTNGGSPPWVCMPMVGEVLSFKPILHETEE